MGLGSLAPVSEMIGIGLDSGFDAGSYTTEIRYDFTTDDVYLDVVAIPEPGTYALLAGLTGLVFVMVRRRS